MAEGSRTYRSMKFSSSRLNSRTRCSRSMKPSSAWRRDARAARIVELRFFAGLSVAQTADVLKCSLTTVKSEWAFAKAWLRSEMEGEYEA